MTSQPPPHQLPYGAQPQFHAARPLPAGPPESRGRAPHPGWAARILFWAGLIVGRLPALVIVPFSIVAGRPGLDSMLSISGGVTGVIELILGIAALLLIKGSSSTRRLIGAAVFFVVTVFALVSPFVLTPLLNHLMMTYHLPMSTLGIVYGIQSVVIVAGMLIAWNVARSRTWWTHLVAVGIAIVGGIIAALSNAVIGTAASRALSLYAVVTVVSQVISIALMFGGLGLLHVLGNLPSGTVRARSTPQNEDPRPAWRQGQTTDTFNPPNDPYDQSRGPYHQGHVPYTQAHDPYRGPEAPGQQGAPRH